MHCTSATASRGDDLRVSKTDVGAGTTYYLDDDDGSPILELDSNVDVLAMNGYGPTGWVARDYPTGSALAATFGAQDYSFTYDPEGNLAQRHPAYAAGAAGLDVNIYDAYGAHLADIATATGTTEALVDPVGFGGQYGYYFDQETGKSLLGHRYYDSAYGRFLNRDPIGYSGGTNLYGYAGNNPVTGSDPSGLDADAVRILGSEEAQKLYDAGLRPEQLAKFLPGKYAGGSIPLPKGASRNFTKAQKALAKKIMEDTGCHTCGTKVAGTKSGDPIIDHNFGNDVNPAGREQVGYPHCQSDSNSQGGTMSNLKQNRPDLLDGIKKLLSSVDDDAPKGAVSDGVNGVFGGLNYFDVWCHTHGYLDWFSSDGGPAARRNLLNWVRVWDPDNYENTKLQLRELTD